MRFLNFQLSVFKLLSVVFCFVFQFFVLVFVFVYFPFFAFVLFYFHRFDCWLRFPIFVFAKTIATTIQQRTVIDSKLIITVLPLLKPIDAKSEWVARVVNKAKYASHILSRCNGYYLVCTECFRIWLTIDLSLWMPRTKRLSNSPQLTQHWSSLRYPFSSLPMPNKNELPGMAIKQVFQSSILFPPPLVSA